MVRNPAKIAKLRTMLCASTPSRIGRPQSERGDISLVDRAYIATNILEAISTIYWRRSSVSSNRLQHHRATINNRATVTRLSLLPLPTQEILWFEMMPGSSHWMKAPSSLVRQHVQHSHHVCASFSYTRRQKSICLGCTTSKTVKSCKPLMRMHHGQVDHRHICS